MDSQLKQLKFGILKYSDPTPEALMASTTIGQLLPLPYKESEAGSNPREFQGMKSGTNKKILKSFIKNHHTTFWALHSGVSITVINGRVESGLMQFDDACLTNGLQTVTIGRILTLIKAYQNYAKKSEIHTKINANMEKNWRECIQSEFPPDLSEQLSTISLQHVNSVLNWLGAKENKEYLAIVNKMTLQEILDTKVSVKAVLLNELAQSVPKLDREPDLERLGNEIAEANNETQKVDPGDLFGTGHQAWLEEQLFDLPLENAVIEYPRFSEDRNGNGRKIIPVLDLLRPILPTTFIVDNHVEDFASFVAEYANRREPIYNWFKRLIKIHQSHSRPDLELAVRILRNLNPGLVEMMFKVQGLWDEQRKALSFSTVNNWISLKNTSLREVVFEDHKKTRPNSEADALIRKFLTFSFPNLFTIFIFATRSAISVAEDLTVTYNIDDLTLVQMVRGIHESLARERLRKTLGSTSDLFRDPEIYRNAAALFDMINKAKGQQYDDSVSNYRVRLS